jgi:hypothetical protein
MTSSLTHLTHDQRQSLAAELAPGERVLYAAQPNWRAEWGKLAAIFMFGMFWSSISFTMFVASIGAVLGYVPFNGQTHSGFSWTTLAFFAFTLPFVAIGLGCLAAPFLGVRKSRNTVHAITEQRLVNVYAGSDKGSESYPLSRVNFMKRRDRRNGTGNLQIGYGVEKDSDGDPRPLMLDWSGIPDVKRAEAIIREQAKWVA